MKGTYPSIDDSKKTEKSNVFFIYSTTHNSHTFYNSKTSIMRDFPTKELTDSYIHYTCQSVDCKKLQKYNIEQIGDMFSIGGDKLAPEEVLKVPKQALAQKGYRPQSPTDAQVLIESFLRTL
jgi:hypothetical protein